MFGREIGGALSGLSIPGGVISGAIWLGFSLFLRKPKFHHWLILGFISPFIGGPLVFTLVAAIEGGIASLSDLLELIVAGILSTVLLVWLVVPIGLLMGAIAGGLARLFAHFEMKQKAL